MIMVKACKGWIKAPSSLSFLDLVSTVMIYNSLCTSKKLKYRKVRFSLRSKFLEYGT
jgi:hypothetical protein